MHFLPKKSTIFAESILYLAYYTDINLEICNYAQKQRICCENCKYALDENFMAIFAPDERLPSSTTLQSRHLNLRSEGSLNPCPNKENRPHSSKNFQFHIHVSKLRSSLIWLSVFFFWKNHFSSTGGPESPRFALWYQSLVILRGFMSEIWGQKSMLNSSR